MHLQDRLIIQEENNPFVEKCAPYVNDFAYKWIQMQARKRNHLRKNGDIMNRELQKMHEEEIRQHSCEKKRKWVAEILTKLRKDIQPEYREIFIEALSNRHVSKCVLSNPDQKEKMRRIDPMKQADKVWRLDLLVMILFFGAPLESTNGERITKDIRCKNKKLCINPTHINIIAKDIDIYISKSLNSNNDSLIPTNISALPLPNPIRYNPYGAPSAKLRQTSMHGSFDNEVDSTELPYDLKNIKTEKEYISSPTQASPPLNHKEVSPISEIYQDNYIPIPSRYGKIRSRFYDANGYSKSCPDFTKYPQSSNQNYVDQYTSNENIANGFTAPYYETSNNKVYPSYQTPNSYNDRIGYCNKFEQMNNYEAKSQMLNNSNQSLEYDFQSNSNTSPFTSSASQNFEQPATSIHQSYEQDTQNVQKYESSLPSTSISNGCIKNPIGGMYATPNVTKYNQQLPNEDSTKFSQLFNGETASRCSQFSNNFPAYSKFEQIETPKYTKCDGNAMNASMENLFIIANQMSFN